MVFLGFNFFFINGSKSGENIFNIFNLDLIVLTFELRICCFLIGLEGFLFNLDLYSFNLYYFFILDIDLFNNVEMEIVVDKEDYMSLVLLEN